MMTVEELIGEASRNRTGVMPAESFSPAALSKSLRMILSILLESIDYDGDKKSGPAIAARALAALISNADDLVDSSSFPKQ